MSGEEERGEDEGEAVKMTGAGIEARMRLYESAEFISYFSTHD